MLTEAPALTHQPCFQKEWGTSSHGGQGPLQRQALPSGSLHRAIPCPPGGPCGGWTEGLHVAGQGPSAVGWLQINTGKAGQPGSGTRCQCSLTRGQLPCDGPSGVLSVAQVGDPSHTDQPLAGSCQGVTSGSFLQPAVPDGMGFQWQPYKPPERDTPGDMAVPRGTSTDQPLRAQTTSPQKFQEPPLRDSRGCPS